MQAGPRRSFLSHDRKGLVEDGRNVGALRKNIRGIRPIVHPDRSVVPEAAASGDGIDPDPS